MKIYTIEKDTMRAVKSILKASEKSYAGVRDWTRHAYLYAGGLILTDGRRLLKVHDPYLEDEFWDFIRETGHAVVFDLNGDGLEYTSDLPINDTNVGTMEKLIVSDKQFEYGDMFRNRFSQGTAVRTKDISASMLNYAVLSTGCWFNPESFDGMGIRPWEKVLGDPTGSTVWFKTAADEYFICKGLIKE